MALHVLGIEPLEQQVAVGKFVVDAVVRLETYGSTFAALHPAACKEIETMARTKRALEMDIRPVVDFVGLAELIEKIGKKKIIQQLGKQEIIQQLGKKDVLEQMDVDDIMENLPPHKRRELLRRLNAESKK
jgi:Mg/Co/Ni transporter MgtE